VSRKDDGFSIDDLFEGLSGAPAWVGPALAGVGFLTLRFGGPFLLRLSGADELLGKLVSPMLSYFAWLFALAVLLIWIFAEIKKFQNRRLLDRQTDISSIHRLSWQQFELLVCEAYRRHGYAAAAVGTACGDGGVDVRLTRDGKTTLVQCKQWRSYKVGVRPVRELLGVVISEHAARGILVTSGQFTSQAIRFALANPQLELIDGAKLATLVGHIQASSATTVHSTAAKPGTAQEAPHCPQCGAVMEQRTARQGAGAGSMFWGCANFPRCRGTRPLATAQVAE
jgi:restriction system protein